MDTPTLHDIEEARERIAGKVHRTPMLTSRTLGERLGVEIYIKAELFQKTGSFKARGAYNNIAQLSDDEKARGIITVSSGNHAGATAWAAQAAGVSATVVMAESASPVKVAACRGYGANVVLHGATATEAFAEMYRLAEERHLTFIHPFDSDRTLAGTGTIGLEILEDVPDADTVVAGIGGGGLIGGVATAIGLAKPSARVIGVEPTGADAMTRSLAAGEVVHLDHVETIADGLAPPFVGRVAAGGGAAVRRASRHAHRRRDQGGDALPDRAMQTGRGTGGRCGHRCYPARQSAAPPRREGRPHRQRRQYRYPDVEEVPVGRLLLVVAYYSSAPRPVSSRPTIRVWMSCVPS